MRTTQNLDAMAIFASVADAGSFSGAARELGMPLSTVSRKIGNLETELGVRLIERSTRRMRLTEAGEVYAIHCRRGRDAFDAANAAVLETRRDISGVLRLSLPPNLADNLFVPIITRFQTRYPKARINVLVTERRVDLINDGVDLSFRVGDLKSSNLVARRLMSYRHILVASPDYLKNSSPPEHPTDLHDHRMLLFGNWPSQFRKLGFSDGLRHESMDIRPAFSINDLSALLTAASLNHGIAEIPSILCGQALRHGAVVEVLPDWKLPEVALSALHTGSTNMTRLLRLFLDECIDHINQLTDNVLS